MLYFPLTSLTVCHATHDCLTSTEFLILLIRHWKYSSCSFWQVLVSSLWAFLSFCSLVFVFFFFFKLRCFFFHAISFFIVSQGTVHLTLVHIHHLEHVFHRCFLKIIKLVFFTVTIYRLLISLLANEDQSYCKALSVSYFCIDSGKSLLRILWLEDTPSKEV